MMNFAGSDLTVAEEITQYLGYIKDPRYLRTSAAMDSRPVVFIFNSADFGSAAEPAGAELVALNASAIAAGLPPLYFIGQVFSASQQAQVSFPVDGFSTYGLGPAGGSEPFSAHAKREAALWDSMSSKGQTVIPTFTPFWDSRPQNAGCCKVSQADRRPCPWCGECGTHAVTNETECALGGAHSQLPAPGEAAAQMRKMLKWVGNNQQASDVGLGLLSAWNENLEGHFVMPSWTPDGDNATLLEELGTVLRPGESGADTPAVIMVGAGRLKTDENSDDGGFRSAAGPGGYTPGWAPTYDMKLSTVIQPCNKDQLMSKGKNWPTIRSFGLIDIDWSNRYGVRLLCPSVLCMHAVC